ncbi:MAG: hypothetical protein OXH06_18100, partial [Gemmatimonadetes bacterium]|nr:hypothetical protein [Gemmatimonadota bacterium]
EPSINRKYKAITPSPNAYEFVGSLGIQLFLVEAADFGQADIGEIGQSSTLTRIWLLPLFRNPTDVIMIAIHYNYRRPRVRPCLGLLADDAGVRRE